MRRTLVLLHRWFGLTTAIFLFIAGATGAIISWDHELDEWLNPQLFKTAHSTGKMLSPEELVSAVERADSRIRVSGVPLHYEQGHTAILWVDTKVDPATGRRYQTGYNHVFVDPSTAEVIGRREWGKISLDREHLMSFLYKLHFSLHIPEMAGTDRWGIWLMGIIALIWLINSLISFFLTLPVRRKTISTKFDDRQTANICDCLQQSQLSRTTWWQRWKPAWLINRRGSAFRINFDLHRAGGLWFLGFILILAFTSFSLNLYREVFYPAMSLVSKVTPGPFELRQPTPLHQPIEPRVGWSELIELGKLEAKIRDWSEPVGDLFYSDNFGIHGIRFFQQNDDHGGGGLGAKTLYYDGQTGQLLGDRIPWKGTMADRFVQLQFPLHSGRILGLPGRIMISIIGLVIAMLSVTGVVIWWKKRLSRLAATKTNHKSLVFHD